MMQADDKTPTADLANEIARLMATAPDVEFDEVEIREMVPGMTETGARAAMAWLMAAGRAEEHHGYYRLTGDAFESDGGPFDEAEAGRRIDEERNEQAGREINALAKLQRAGLDAATCSEEQAASIEGVGPLMAVRLCRQERRLAALGYVPD